MKALLIARVSTEDQKDALPAQVHRLLDYAERNNFDHELIQFQESAYKGNRDEFKAIIDKILQYGELVAVVFDKVDRLSRDSTDQEVRTLQNLSKVGAIELHFPSDNLVIHKGSPATDLMRLGLNTVLAQYYSDAISDNVKRRLDQKLRDGEWIGMAPYGYKNVTLPNGKKTVEIDEYAAGVVRSVYEWYATGVMSFKLITRKLETTYGITFAASKVEYLLKNPFYVGDMRVKGKLYPHNYVHVISDKLKAKVEAVRLGYNIKPMQSAGLPYRYRGVVRCADCDCTVTFEKKKGLYVYGHCTQTKGKHGATYLAEKSFTEQLTRMFDSIAMPEEAYNEVSAAYEKSYKQDVEAKAENLRQLDAEIKRTQMRIERVYEDYLDEKIPEDLYRRKFDEFTEAKQKLETRRNNFELIEKDTFETISHLLRLSKNAPKLFKKADFEQTRELIKMVCSNLELAGKELRWKLKKPYDCMALCNVSGNWLRGLDSNQRPRR